MKKAPMRYYANENRNTLISDAIATAVAVTGSLIVLGVILVRSGLLPVI